MGAQTTLRATELRSGRTLYDQLPFSPFSGDDARCSVIVRVCPRSAPLHGTGQAAEEPQSHLLGRVSSTSGAAGAGGVPHRRANRNPVTSLSTTHPPTTTLAPDRGAPSPDGLDQEGNCSYPDYTLSPRPRPPSGSLSGIRVRLPSKATGSTARPVRTPLDAAPLCCPARPTQIWSPAAGRSPRRVRISRAPRTSSSAGYTRPRTRGCQTAEPPSHSGTRGALPSTHAAAPRAPLKTRPVYWPIAGRDRIDPAHGISARPSTLWQFG